MRTNEMANFADLRNFQVDQSLDPEIIDLWATSPEREWYFSRRGTVFMRFRWALLFIVGAVILTSFGNNLKIWLIEDPYVIVGFFFVIGAILLFWSAMPFISARQAYSARKRGVASYRTDEALRDLKQVMSSQDQGMQLPSLFYLNRRQLDEYQVVTKQQQKIAFALTWSATVFAFLILVGGTLVTLAQSDDVEKYLTGGLTALGTLLSGFLGKTFYDGHKIATDQFNHYYTEPSLTGRLLAAERILSHLPEDERNKQVIEIISAILKWEPTKETADASESQKNPEENDAASIL